MFFVGKLYSREVLSQKQRELCAVAALTVLDRPRELAAHIHAALNVGATRQEVAEAIFQQVTYGGMPVVVEALEVYAGVLRERGEPFPADEAYVRSRPGGGGGGGAGRRRAIALKYYRAGFA